MRPPGAFGPFVAAVIALACAACATESGPADLVLRGGTVRTMDEAQPLASALAVRDGRIVYVGQDAGVAAHVGDATELSLIHI